MASGWKDCKHGWLKDCYKCKFNIPDPPSYLIRMDHFCSDHEFYSTSRFITNKKTNFLQKLKGFFHV